MITVEEAAREVLSKVPPPRETTVDLDDALGHVLAEPVTADLSMPPWDKSAMDGFAVRCADVAKTPVELDVIEEIPAGKAPTRAVGPGRCSKIMTGAPMPEGADAVVQVEDTEPAGGRVRILRGVKRRQNVCLKAEDLEAGQTVLAPGAVLRPPELAVLATCGRRRVKVWAKPRCAVLATGDELVEVDEIPRAGQIRNSNTRSISAQVRAMGLPCDVLGIACDTIDAIREKIRSGLQRDVLLISGGVSAGDYDFVIDALHAEGVTTVFHQVRIKPGRPFTFGVKGDKRVFALPGNPVSTLVLFEVYVRPFLGRMMGSAALDRLRLRARLSKTFSKTSDRVQFVPGLLARVGDGWRIDVVPWHGSADVFGLLRADAFAIIPAGEAVEEGRFVDVMLMDPANPA